MKRIIIVLMVLIMLIGVVSCSSDDTDKINTALVKKYTTNEKYYKNVYNDVEVEDFGNKYAVPIYDVSENEQSIQFYYSFDGEEEFKMGRASYEAYLKYLEANFGLNESEKERSGVLSYDMADGKYIKVMPYYMKNDNGMVIVVSVPINEYVPSSDNQEEEYNFIYSSESAGT